MNASCRSCTGHDGDIRREPGASPRHAGRDGYRPLRHGTVEPGKSRHALYVLWRGGRLQGWNVPWIRLGLRLDHAMYFHWTTGGRCVKHIPGGHLVNPSRLSLIVHELRCGSGPRALTVRGLLSRAAGHNNLAEYDKGGFAAVIPLDDGAFGLHLQHDAAVESRAGGPHGQHRVAR